MARNEELQKHTLNLCRGDYAKIQALYPDLGAGAVIRKIVRQFVAATEVSATARPDVTIQI